MNEDLHNIPTPPISANAGWKQMQALLNEHLPVEQSMFGKRSRFFYIHSGLLVLIFVLATLQLDQRVTRLDPGQAHIAKAVTVTAPFKVVSGAKTSTDLVFNPGSPANKKPLFNTALNALPASFKNWPFVSAADVDQPYGEPAGDLTRLDNILPDQFAAGTFRKAVPLPVISTSLPQSAPTRTRLNKPSWNLFAGIGTTISINNDQQLQPFPVAEARLQLSPRIYAAAGLSAWSPVAANTSGISKTTYLNDTINNISLYNEITTYKNLYYADIPLSLGVNLGRHLSLQAGLQVSVLLGKKVQQQLVPYDFQMNSVRGPVPAVTTFAPNPQNTYDVKVHPVDYRFAGGLRYTVDKAVIGLTYQQGFRPLASGVNTNKNNRQAISLSVMYRLK